MRNTILIAISIVALISCGKPEGPLRVSRHRGYIYNVKDSMPFAYTKFKVYNNGRDYRIGDEKTQYFFTDSNGYFDVSVGFSGGCYWPSYFDGAAYGGPDVFYPTGGKDSINEFVNQSIIEYKVYTTPYF